MLHERAMYLIATLINPVTPTLYGIPMQQTQIEVVEALVTFYRTCHLKGDIYSQLKQKEQLIGESLQEFVADTDHLAHSAHVDLPEHLISKMVTHAFAEGIREKDMRRQFLLGAGKHPARPSNIRSSI
jgi:hypothetical protein